MRAYVGLGANLGDPAAQVESAIARIAAHDRIWLAARSPLYRSAPLGPGEQPDYCNAVVAVDTGLLPSALWRALQDIERSMGRERSPKRWAPRVIDLDLLHVERMKLKTRDLVIPHPELANRNFVLGPLAEIAPGLDIPGVGQVADCLARLGEQGLRLWNPSS